MLLAISFCAILLPLVIINLILSRKIMVVMISLSAAKLHSNDILMHLSFNIPAQVMYQHFSTQPQVLQAHSYVSIALFNTHYSLNNVYYYTVGTHV